MRSSGQNSHQLRVITLRRGPRPRCWFHNTRRQHPRDGFDIIGREIDRQHTWPLPDNPTQMCEVIYRGITAINLATTLSYVSAPTRVPHVACPSSKQCACGERQIPTWSSRNWKTRNLQWIRLHVRCSTSLKKVLVQACQEVKLSCSLGKVQGPQKEGPTSYHSALGTPTRIIYA